LFGEDLEEFQKFLTKEVEEYVWAIHSFGLHQGVVQGLKI